MRFSVVLVFVLALVSLAGADEQTRVVLAPVDDAALGARIRAELSLLGFEVIDSNEELTDELMRESRAAFALELTKTASGYEVWLRDRVTNKTVVREVIEDPSPRSTALRVVELLRASLLELKARHAVTSDVAADPTLEALADASLMKEAPGPQPPSSTVAPPSMVAPPSIAAPPPSVGGAAPRSPEPGAMDRFAAQLGSTDLRAAGSLEVGALGSYDVGGSGGVMGAQLSGGWFVTRYLQLRLDARVLPRSTLSLPEGQIDLLAAQAGVATALHFIEPNEAFSPFVELGVWGTWLHIAPTVANEALRGNESDAFAVMPVLSHGFSMGSPGFPLRLRGSLGVGVTLPAIEVVVRKRLIVDWGRPLLVGGLAAQWLFE